MAAFANKSRKSTACCWQINQEHSCDIVIKSNLTAQAWDLSGDLLRNPGRRQTDESVAVSVSGSSQAMIR